MSRFLIELKRRVDERIKPHVQTYGQDAPVVRMALQILDDAQAVESYLSSQKATTQEAHEQTEWAAETLQKYARMKLAGEPLPTAWAGLEVEDTPSGYSFVLGSIPENPRAAA